ncbi:MAG: flavin reductase family protein [Rhizobiaceae bacterium]
MLEKSKELTLRSAYVDAMSYVANSVTVVTTDGTAGRHGATVSSFCSVSADPPTVLVCLNNDGHTAYAVRENGSFCVNVLPETESGTAKLFAGIGVDESVDRFSGATWYQGDSGPLLADVTAFSCDVVEAIQATSHLIFIGKVKSVQRGNEKPLIYLDRQFCKIDNPKK